MTITIALLALVPMARFLANPLETRFPQPQLPAAIDGIILLAGAERPETSRFYGEPQVGIEAGRYILALRLAARYPAARIVYTGGPRHKTGASSLGSQTAVAAEILGTVGLASDRVAIDERSLDTCEHPRNVRILAKPKSGERWVVVTTAMHMPRVVACFRAAGWPDVIPQPTSYRTVPDATELVSLQLNSNLAIVDEATHEWIGPYIQAQRAHQ